ncbi:MAG: host attachment protein [Rhizobiaceae bacterium]|nr:host attachment protein [Rhizobiaceae bacterium]|tara:strand:- start:5612 stop:6049 length:438 start_codon:yes stop_codon:yes gene_type:complete
MKPIKTWILIADASGGRIYENTGPGRGLEPVENRNWKAPKEADFADQPGRSFSSHGSARHKMEVHAGHNEPADILAKEIMEDLMQSRHKNLFERLILCAPPAMLGRLRKQLPDQLKADVTAEIAKDLVGTPPLELPGHFSDVLAV